jgi:hypothetical protein
MTGTVPQFGKEKSAKLKVALMNSATQIAADTCGTFIQRRRFVGARTDKN